MKRLRDLGADVVGINCHLGPDLMLEAIEPCVKTIPGPIFCSPVAYRTTNDYPGVYFLPNTDPLCESDIAFPESLEYHQCTRN